MLKRLAENPRRAGIIAPCIWPTTTPTLLPEKADAVCVSTSQKMSKMLYQLLDSAMTDPKGKLREAEREVAVRRRVLELTR